MPPGVLWVASRIADKGLSEERFCDWYENQHIQEVTALPGVPTAARYQAISPQPTSSAWSVQAPWLTVYEMPDIDYRNGSDFKALDGQSKPSEELLEDVFKRARFDTRFYSQLQVYEGKGGEGKSDGYKPAKFLASAALHPKEGTDEDFEKWYREEHLQFLSGLKGFVRSRRYEVVDTTILDQFERKQTEVGGDVPKYLALHEFEGEGFPWEGLQASAETEWSKKVMGSVEVEEVGWYELKRVYEETQDQAAGVGDKAGDSVLD